MATIEQTIVIKTEVDNSELQAAFTKSGKTVEEFEKIAEKAGFTVEKASKKGGKAAKGMAGNVKTLGGSFSALKASTLGAVAAMAAAGAMMAKATKAAAEFEQVTKRLQLNLELSGVSSKSFTQGLLAQASALQKTTRFSDGAIVSAQALLASMGVAPDQLGEASKIVADVAAATGKSLETVAQQAGKTVGGFAGELGELIPEVKALTTEELKAGKALELLGRRFGGAAAEDAKTFSGAMAQAENALGDVLKQIGKFTTESPSAIKLIKEMADGFNTLAENIANAGNQSEISTLNKRVEELTKLEDKLQKLKRSGPRLSGGFSRTGFNAQFEGGLDNQAEIEEKLRKIGKERLGLAQKLAKLEVAGREAKINDLKKSAKELEIAKRKREEAAKLLAIEKERETFKTEFETIKGEIEKESETRLEAIATEFREREDAIEKAHRLEIISTKEAFELKQTSLRILETQAKEANTKIADDQKKKDQDALQAHVQGIQNMIGTINSLSQGGIGAIGAGVGGLVGGVAGGPGGMMAGMQIGQALAGMIESFMSIGGEPGGQVFAGSNVIQVLIKTNEGLSRSLNRLSNTLDNFEAAFMSTPERATRFEEKLSESREFTDERIKTLRAQVRNGVSSGALAGGLESFLIAMDEEANAVIDATTALIAMKEEALVPIREEIARVNNEVSRLQGLKGGVASAFESAIMAVGGGLETAAQTVSRLKQSFSGATGEEKGALGAQLASALTNQFTGAQALAQSGAISGEELALLQKDILAELEATQSESLSEFDRLISSQESVIAQLESQEAAIVREIETLEETAVAQLDQLREIRDAIEAGNLDLVLALGGVPRFADGTESVQRTGLAVVHQGERITPANDRAGGSGGTITININASGGADANAIAKAVSEAIKLNLSGIRTQIARVS